MSPSLRTRILLALLSAVALTDLLAAVLVNQRIMAGARREAAGQARAQAAQVRAMYAERAATLAAEGEAVSLYPAVIAAIADGNAQPLLRWSGQVATLQDLHVTVTDASGRVVARGHDPQRTGDALAPSLAGLRLALSGQKVAGAESGDELGLAVRGYAPVLREGSVVGAVMIADPLDDRLLRRLAGGDGAALRIATAGQTGAGSDGGCRVTDGAPAASCVLPVAAPDGQPAAALILTVPLAEIERARAEAQRALGAAGVLLLCAGALVSWLLARSLARPLAHLTAATHRLAGGDYERPIEGAGLRRGDEIGVLARAFDAMRREIAATAGALRRERDVLGAVLNAVGDGILMAGAQGETVVANERWAALLGGDGLAAAGGLARVGGAGGSFREAAGAWLRDATRVVAADFEAAGPPHRRYRCYSAPVRGRGEDDLGRLFVLRDVTRESEAERMRSALVATVSHELRSPLATIAGYTDTLLHGGPWDAATTREFLDIVAQAADTLARLVENVLDAAKLEAGVLALEREPVRLERIAQRVVSQHRALAPRHTLEVDAAPGVPLVDADPLRVEQVVANLVENAIKYSPDGGTITVKVVAGRDGRDVQAGVLDRGVGIAPEHAERLFERFYRVDNGLARTTKGVGLGLFICRSLVEAHGGRIWLESRPGQGSAFWFTLPALAGETRPEPEQPAALEPAGARSAARAAG